MTDHTPLTDHCECFNDRYGEFDQACPKCSGTGTVMTTPLTEEELAVMDADASSFATAANLRDLIADLRASRAELADSDADANAWMRQALASRAEVERLQKNLERHHVFHPGNWQVCEVCS